MSLDLGRMLYVMPSFCCRTFFLHTFDSSHTDQKLFPRIFLHLEDNFA